MNKPHPYATVLQWVAEGKEIEAAHFASNKWFVIPHGTILKIAALGIEHPFYRPQDFRLKPERHVHQDLIDQRKNGVKIQMYLDGNWNDVQPQWAENREYRIKPCSINMYAGVSLCSRSNDIVEHGWSQERWSTDNIKAVFCSETNELLSIELLKD